MYRLFVYGIFLNESTRKSYGMSNPHYEVVPNYATYEKYGNIVEAIEVDEKCNAALTGLSVEVDPDRWKDIDLLESGYNRKLVKTIDNKDVYMYVGR